VNYNGYYWMLAECEARELPNDGESVKFLLWNGRKKNNKSI
jgi:hypothetical protein